MLGDARPEPRVDLGHLGSRESDQGSGSASMFPRQGRDSRRPRAAQAPRLPKRSVTGQGRQKLVGAEWMPVRQLAGASPGGGGGRRALARGAPGSGSRIAGTRSRSESTARTRASIRSYFAASGARPDLLGVGDLYDKPWRLRVSSTSGAGHRLDPRARRARRASTPSARAPAAASGDPGQLVDQLLLVGEQADVEALLDRSGPACDIPAAPWSALLVRAGGVPPGGPSSGRALAERWA